MNRRVSKKRIWITKSISSDDKLYEGLKSKGLIIIDYPLIQLTKNNTQKLWQAIDCINEYSWIIIPSPNAARYLYDTITKSRTIDIDNIKPKISCLGAKTNKQAKSLGFNTSHISDNANIQDLINTIPLEGGDRILYFTSDRKNKKLNTNIIKEKKCVLKKIQ